MVTRAPAGPQNDTAQPSLTSGFGAVMEKEHDLQSMTEGSCGHASGQRSTEIDRILRHQHFRLGANIALLEQRYEALPIPERFTTWHDRRHPPVTARRRAVHDETDLLSDLIAQHTSLIADIDELIGCAADGQRGELILTEVGRNHEEMAWMLTALLNEDETAGRIADAESGRASEDTRQAQDNWDNEGGPVSMDRPMN